MKTEKEQYIVRYDLQQANGYWRNNLQELVEIGTPPALVKNNHDAAADVIKKKYPGCKIVCTTYC